eukprot:Gb_08139 [translate_table: standard]
MVSRVWGGVCSRLKSKMLRLNFKLHQAWRNVCELLGNSLNWCESNRFLCIIYPTYMLWFPSSLQQSCGLYMIHSKTPSQWLILDSGGTSHRVTALLNLDTVDVTSSMKVLYIVIIAPLLNLDVYKGMEQTAGGCCQLYEGA